MFAVACCIADFMAKFRFNIVFSCIYLWEEALPDKFNHIFVFVIFFWHWSCAPAPYEWVNFEQNESYAYAIDTEKIKQKPQHTEC